ncbi:MAG TPA: sulfate ABC transporter permease subunit CysW [Planctomycetota bacterium]
MRHDVPWWVRHLLILAALVFAAILLVLPLLNVLAEAFAHGLGGYLKAVADPHTLHAVFLTSFVALIAVAVNLVFGVSAAWALTRYDFPGKSLLVTLIDLPFSVSPVVSGLIYVLTIGLQTKFGAWLDSHGIQILFATPGIVIATTFVTFPFVARETMPVMEAVGADQEEAALTLGASGWQTFWMVTLPNIKWGVIYGVILCGSRAMGEFGAVSVVAGRISGKSDTMSLRVEKLYQDFQSQAAFTVASLLLLLAVVTLVIKSVVEWRIRKTLEESSRKADVA